MNRLAAVFAVFLAVACQRVPEAPVAPAPRSDDTLILENANLANLVFGASVVDRDNEVHFEFSAAHAIDGTAQTPWTDAPGGPLTGVFALAAPAELHRLGAALATTEPGTLRIETSMDGMTWSKSLDLPVKTKTAAPQLAGVKPVVARYLRVTLDAPTWQRSILSLHAYGREVAPFVQPNIDGCWEINNRRARFARTGTRVSGVLDQIAVDGGTDGRVYRLTWLEGPQWGFAAITISPDGQHLSGVRWHEEVNPKNNGDGWLGHRVPCSDNAIVDSAGIVDAIIARTGLWRLYGNDLDAVAKLIRDHPQHRFRLIARDFHPNSIDRCKAKLEELRTALKGRGTDLSRVEFVTAGTARSELSIDFTTQRAMDSVVDLEVVPR